MVSPLPNCLVHWYFTPLLSSTARKQSSFAAFHFSLSSVSCGSVARMGVLLAGKQSFHSISSDATFTQMFQHHPQLSDSLHTLPHLKLHQTPHHRPTNQDIDLRYIEISWRTIALIYGSIWRSIPADPRGGFDIEPVQLLVPTSLGHSLGTCLRFSHARIQRCSSLTKMSPMSVPNYQFSDSK